MYHSAQFTVSKTELLVQNTYSLSAAESIRVEFHLFRAAGDVNGHSAPRLTPCSIKQRRLIAKDLPSSQRVPLIRILTVYPSVTVQRQGQGSKGQSIVPSYQTLKKWMGIKKCRKLIIKPLKPPVLAIH